MFTSDNPIDGLRNAISKDMNHVYSAFDENDISARDSRIIINSCIDEALDIAEHYYLECNRLRELLKNSKLGN